MRRLLYRFLQPNGRKRVSPDTVVVVSGLPRSGTSMMMAMLERGGLFPLTDAIRLPDDDNPKGYYEFERVKQLEKGDVAWLAEAKGKAVKVISALLKYLPPQYTYHVVYMNRQLTEVLDSQRKMLQHKGQTVDPVSDAQLAKLMSTHETQVKAWLIKQPNFHVVEVDYNAILNDPVTTAQRINAFLAYGLDEKRMVGVVDHGLYRNRGKSVTIRQGQNPS